MKKEKYGIIQAIVDFWRRNKITIIVGLIYVIILSFTLIMSEKGNPVASSVLRVLGEFVSFMTLFFSIVVWIEAQKDRVAYENRKKSVKKTEFSNDVVIAFFFENEWNEKHGGMLLKKRLTEQEIDEEFGAVTKYIERNESLNSAINKNEKLNKIVDKYQKGHKSYNDRILIQCSEKGRFIVVWSATVPTLDQDQLIDYVFEFESITKELCTELSKESLTNVHVFWKGPSTLCGKFAEEVSPNWYNLLFYQYEKDMNEGNKGKYLRLYK